MSEDNNEIDVEKIMTEWVDGIRENRLPIESIIVLERLFRFLISDYGPVIIGTICRNEIDLFKEHTAVPEIQTEGEEEE